MPTSAVIEASAGRAFLLPGHELQGTDEARRVTCGEHLLGVGAVTASATQFLGVLRLTTSLPSLERDLPSRPPVEVASAMYSGVTFCILSLANVLCAPRLEEGAGWCGI